MGLLLITHYRRPIAIKFEYFINTLRILSSFINLRTRQIVKNIPALLLLFDYTTCITGQDSLAYLIVYSYSKLVKHTFIVKYETQVEASARCSQEHRIIQDSPSGLHLPVAYHSLKFVIIWVVGGVNSLFLYLNYNFKICIFGYK